MPVQTQILTRRGTAASWTSTNPTLGAGEIGYETDTGRFKIGTGAAAWASLSYFNRDPLTTKGDLYTFSTTDDRLAVGNNGETLVADSSTSTGLRYNANYAAGKNKIINGDFGIWQRGTSFTNPLAGVYTADRYRTSNTTDPTSRTISQQTFTPGTAPVAGYESQFFLRSVLTTLGSSTGIRIQNVIEDVRTMAGQTVTLSFWAKSDTTRTQPASSIDQNFGSGGSATVATSASTYVTTTAWQRFSFTLTMPSISGKTIGTNSHLRVSLEQNITDGNTMDIWGVQLEAGSVATAFQTATGTLQGELAACQRYYYRSTGSLYSTLAAGSANSATLIKAYTNLPVTMRTKPSAVDYATLCGYDNATVYGGTITAAIDVNLSTPSIVNCDFTGFTGLNAYRPYWILANSSTSGYLGFSAEL